MTEVRQLFFEESFENLDMMESSLLDLEIGAVDKELINTIFRAAHSIKGGAGIFKFEHVINFAHTVETLLDELRNDQHIVTQHLIDLLLRGVDTLRALLKALQTGQEYNPEAVLVCQQEFTALLITPMSPPPEHAHPHPENTHAPVTAPEVIPVGWHIRFKPYPRLLQTGNDPINLFRALDALGELQICADSSQLPTFADLDFQNCYLSWDLLLTGAVEQTAITEIFEWVEGDCDLEMIPLDKESLAETRIVMDKALEASLAKLAKVPEKIISPAPSETPVNPKLSSIPIVNEVLEKPAHNEHLSSHINEASSIRVGIDKIDALINIVGELVITQSMLDQVGEDFNLARLEQLRSGLAQLERNTRELQESVMRIRMLPISYSFNRFPRLVHDLSTQLGKKVEIKLSGEQTELDKTVLEKMSDPLVHLVRNALDHGIEMPEQRRAAGKPETGILKLHAFHQGGNIMIQISDDGAGFNLERIQQKAIDKGLLHPDENPTVEQLYEFIFHPGFSTAQQVSDLSGRGVGMDVVRRNIRDLGGTIEIKSEIGKGSRFSIRLPLTLAILDGQLVRVGNRIYILSLLSIIESLRIQPNLLSVLAGKAEVYRVRDEYIPILRLYALFNIIPSTTQLEQGILVIVEGEGQKIGLFVDELLSQQQIVIKSLETNYKQIHGISGATILGDGSVALILDVAGLIRQFYSSNRVHTFSELSVGAMT